MLLLLNLHDSTILEAPLHDVRLLRCTFDILALADSRPELGEVLQLDEVPDVAQWRTNDRALHDGG